MAESNLNQIANIIENVFAEELDTFLRDCVEEMEEYDFQIYFPENVVEFAQMDYLDSIEITSCDVDEQEDDLLYSGEGTAQVYADGSVYFDKEYHIVDSAIIPIEFSFSFIKSENGQYSDVEFGWEE
ncbi:hypothetical protein [Butyrivibrio sp. WCD2001]|uniref:hypothetical protein n=1 Tax=Butyrivibrio sp. WCD2001 TaxID=1280681 RepID=UPI000418945C|nr:hypothetical protein [Butyrivibrio sp. WCD2001]